MATLLCYATILSYAIALPTSPSSGNSTSVVGTSTASYATVSDNPAFNTNYRSTVEIVWSCLTVVFASSWLCVHPNVTGYNTTMWQRLRERLKLFVLAILAPEVLAVFAFYQWWGSRKLYKNFKERAEGLNRPTRLGFEASETLGGPETPNDLKDQVEDPHRRSALLRFWKGIRWPSFKTLARAISSYGTDTKKATWSYTHAHFVQMGGIVFRDDGGNIGFKRPEDWKDEDLRVFFALKLPEGAVSDRSKAGALAKTLVVARVLWFLIQAIARKAQGLPFALLEVASLAFIAFNFAMYVFWWNKPLDVEYPLEMHGIPDQHQHRRDRGALVLNLSSGVLDAIPIGVWLYSPQRQSYPRLYSFGKRMVEFHTTLFGYSGSSSTEFDYIFDLTVAVTSSSFGAFHTMGWYLPAPSQVERTLWRVSSLVLTLYPFVVLVLAVLHHILFHKIAGGTSFERNFDIPVHLIVLLVSVLGGIAYVGARLAIIFLPFFELRNLPLLVHETVSWSRFLSPI